MKTTTSGNQEQNSADKKGGRRHGRANGAQHALVLSYWPPWEVHTSTREGRSARTCKQAPAPAEQPAEDAAWGSIPLVRLAWNHPLTTHIGSARKRNEFSSTLSSSTLDFHEDNTCEKFSNATFTRNCELAGPCRIQAAT